MHSQDEDDRRLMMFRSQSEASGAMLTQCTELHARFGVYLDILLDSVIAHAPANRRRKNNPSFNLRPAPVGF